MLYSFKSTVCPIEDKYSSLEQFYIETSMRSMKTEIYHEKNDAIYLHPKSQINRWHVAMTPIAIYPKDTIKWSLKYEIQKPEI